MIRRPCTYMCSYDVSFNKYALLIVMVDVLQLCSWKVNVSMSVELSPSLPDCEIFIHFIYYIIPRCPPSTRSSLNFLLKTRIKFENLTWAKFSTILINRIMLLRKNLGVIARNRSMYKRLDSKYSKEAISCGRWLLAGHPAWLAVSARALRPGRARAHATPAPAPHNYKHATLRTDIDM